MPAQARAQGAVGAISAPLRGWIDSDNLADNPGGGCSVLENGFPTTSSVRVRGGALLKTVVGVALEGFLTYRSGAVDTLFAATAGSIFDVSLFPSTVGLPIWTGGTNGRWSFTQMVVAGIEHLVAVNGADLAIHYDGTDLNPLSTAAIKSLAFDGLTQAFVIGRTLTGGTSSATGVIVGIIPTGATTGRLKLRSVSGTFQNDEAITGSGTAGGAAVANGVAADASSIVITGVATSDLSHVWQHGSRLWFVQDGTTKAWYLPVDSIGGTATSFDFGGLFSEGGALLFGAKWSSDSGSGFNDRNVFVSTEGEIVVFEGNDPSDADTWMRVGTYKVGRPISSQTWTAGGDLILCTEDGLVPMSAVVTKDQAALSHASLTANIEAPWRMVTGTNVNGVPVQMLKWQSHNMGLVGFPHRSGTDAFVVNLITGAWAKWTGLDIQCIALHDGWAYMGDEAGNVLQLEAAGADNEMPFVWRMSWLPTPLGAPGVFKLASLARATFRALVPFTPKLSVANDYGRLFPAAPSAPLDSAAVALWDVGIWGESRWDDAPGAENRVTRVTPWVSVGASGVAVSPQVQVTSGGSRMLDAELVAYDVAYQTGGYVV
jgi:hypothetical protein